MRKELLLIDAYARGRGIVAVRLVAVEGAYNLLHGLRVELGLTVALARDEVSGVGGFGAKRCPVVDAVFDKPWVCTKSLDASASKSM